MITYIVKEITQEVTMIPKNRGKNERKPENNFNVSHYLVKNADLSDLIRNKASDLAESLKVDFDSKNRRKEEMNSNTQLRKFYDELFTYLMSIKANPSKFDEYLPNIYLVASKAMYASGRDKLGKNCSNFIKTNILDISSKEDFERFMLFFEAVLGYYKFFNPKEI